MCCRCKQAVERHWGSSPSLLQSDSLVFLFPCSSREEEPVCYPFDRLDCPAEPHTNPPSPTEDLFSPHGLRATCTDHKPRGSLEVLNLKSIAGVGGRTAPALVLGPAQAGPARSAAAFVPAPAAFPRPLHPPLVFRLSQKMAADDKIALNFGTSCCRKDV